MNASIFAVDQHVMQDYRRLVGDDSSAAEQSQGPAAAMRILPWVLASILAAIALGAGGGYMTAVEKTREMIESANDKIVNLEQELRIKDKALSEAKASRPPIELRETTELRSSEPLPELPPKAELPALPAAVPAPPAAAAAPTKPAAAQEVVISALELREAINKARAAGAKPATRKPQEAKAAQEPKASEQAGAAPSVSWREMPIEFMPHSRSMIETVEKGRLVLKSGASVSMGGNLPTGEKVIGLDPGSRTVITDRRILNITD